MDDQRKAIIKDYLMSYNNFDVSDMLKNLDEQVIFENYSDGKLNVEIKGIKAFKQQAESAKAYFESREQKVTKWTFSGDVVEIEIDYSAVLAMDFPGGMKAGDTLHMKGQSTFFFQGDKIIKIQDRS